MAYSECSWVSARGYTDIKQEPTEHPYERTDPPASGSEESSARREQGMLNFQESSPLLPNEEVEVFFNHLDRPSTNENAAARNAGDSESSSLTLSISPIPCFRIVCTRCPSPPLLPLHITRLQGRTVLCTRAPVPCMSQRQERCFLCNMPPDSRSPPLTVDPPCGCSLTPHTVPQTRIPQCLPGSPLHPHRTHPSVPPP